MLVGGVRKFCTKFAAVRFWQPDFETGVQNATLEKINFL